MTPDRRARYEGDGPFEAYYGLPATVRFCTRCVISNQRPSSTVEFRSTAGAPKETISFDHKGVCAACRYQDVKDREIDWEQREQALIDLCREYRSRAGNYDCIVPGSGGKDSTFTAHVLKSRYGMNPLTVTWAPNLYTDVGFRNLHKWIDSGLDNILFTPNGRVHRLVTRLAFENLVHPFQPFIIGQRHIAPKASVLYGIPLVFYGENQAEYGNSIEENFIPTMKPAFYIAPRDVAGIRLGGVSGADLVASFGVDPRELEPYLPAAPDQVRSVGTVVHYLGYYLKWDPQECYYYAVEHTGFSVNEERTEGSYSKYSSIDDKIDPLHYHTTYIKFGIGRATYDAAQEIRNRKIDREEGVTLVKRYDDEFPHKYFREILDYMDITEDRFYEVIVNARSPHLWRLTDGKWQLRHAVWMDQ